MLPVVTGEYTVVREPELRFAPSGVAVCTVRAVASSQKKVGDQWEDDKKFWVDLTAFSRLAENIAESDLKQGTKILVTGKVYTDEWEDKEGAKRTTTRINIDTFGPSLKFDTVKVNRAERKEQSGSDPWQSGGGSSSASTVPPASDEPPF